MQQDWSIKQVDFSNAFVQATLDKDVHVAMPPMFQDNTSPFEQCLKLNKSLHGMVDSPRHWWMHVQQGLIDLGFKPSETDPGIYFGRGMILMLHVDDLLATGPDATKIEGLFTDLEKAGFALTREETGDDVFHFLGTELNMEEELSLIHI